MNIIYRNTYELAIQSQPLVPITLDSQHLMNCLAQLTGLPKLDTQLDQQSIDEFNSITITILAKAVSTLEEYLFLDWRCSADFILYIVDKQLCSYVQQLDQSTFIKNRYDEYQQSIQDCYKHIHNNIIELIETIVTQLCDDYLSSEQILSTLTIIIEAQVGRVAHDLFDFAYLDPQQMNILWNRIIQLIGRIGEQFFSYSTNVSYYANSKMEYLDHIMTKHQSIANPNNYKYMQREVSHDVLNYSLTQLSTQCFNLYPQLAEQVAKQTIKHFYYLIDEEIPWFTYNKQPTISSLINTDHFKIITPMPQNIQVVGIDEIVDILSNAVDVMVMTSQDIYNDNGNGLRINIQFKGQQSEFIIHLSYHYLLFHQMTDGWIDVGDVMQIKMNLLNFINSEFENLHRGCPDFERRITTEKQMDKEQSSDSMSFQNTGQKFRKIKAPKKPVRYGAKVNLMAGKALGAGLGCFIVDCLDEDIPWDDKFKNAGFTTITLGMLGLMAARLPVVGLLIQQVILVYAIKLILDNKVISDGQTTKNFGHLSIQVGLGVSLTIVGSIVFPVGFWGAFLGGLVGGVAMGLYSKFLIPYAMENLVEMLTQTSCLIRSSGVVRYKVRAIDKMRFDPKFFKNSKPSNYSDDDWFTLLMYCLVNESKGVAKAQYDKVVQKYQRKKLLDTPEFVDIVDRHIQIQAKLELWDICYKHLLKQKIEMLKHAESIAEFVDGMLVNFKIQ